MLNKIKKLLKNKDTDIDDSLIDMFINKLSAISFDLGDEDLFNLMYSLLNAEVKIKNYCNVTKIPKGARLNLLNLALSYFLNDLKSTNSLKIKGLNIEPPAKRIQEGDISIEYDTKYSDDEKISAYISQLEETSISDLVAFRCVKW